MVWQRQRGTSVWLWLANRLVFPQIRKKMVGENLKALICGSAPLTPETQNYFAMLGIPVLQVYGLTETDRNLHHGRSPPSSPGTSGAGDSRNGDEAQ